MSESQKTLKQYCKEAKQRLKSGFWQRYKENLQKELIRAEHDGISTSKVKEFYEQKVSNGISNANEEYEAFYQKVKKMLDEVGEVSDAIGRLTDKELFMSLDYSEQQRYTLRLSENYVVALERYKKEKALNVESSI